MRYANVLTDAIATSRLTYQQVADKCKIHGTSITRFYISKLCTGAKPPASDEVNHALATVLAPYSGISYEALAIAKYKEIIPSDVLAALYRDYKEAI